MKKFIINSTTFLLPIILLIVFFICFYSSKKGDLIRLGYILDTYEYDSKAIFKKDYEQKINLTKIS